MRTTLIVVAIISVTTVSAETVQEFLSAALGAPRTVEDLGPGEPYVIEGGSHDGHQALTWPALDLPRMEPAYGLRYNVCTDRDAHPAMIEVWPREGGLAVGMPRPTGANFYGGGFVDLLLDGLSIGSYRPTIERLTWDGAAGYRFTWRPPEGIIALTFVGRDGADHLLMHGDIDTNVPLNSVEVTLRCFPSSFATPRERVVRLAGRSLTAGQRTLLERDEWWGMCADEHFDEADLPAESSGPCAFAFDPVQVSRAALDVGDYAVTLSLELVADRPTFDVALWEFPNAPNDAALAALQSALDAVEVTHQATDLVQAPPRVLARDGRPAATIVLPQEPTVREATAAHELQSYLQRMSGALLPIARDGEVSAGNRLLIGAVSGYSYPGAEAGMAGFELRTEGRDVLIRGEDDFATLYGACDLLEQLGVRWYLPGRIGEVVPERATVELPELSVIKHPDLPMRWVGHDAWSYRNKCNGSLRDIGKGFSIEPGVYHSQYRFMSATDYFDEHPEWFALEDGRRFGDPHVKPCTTNEEMIRRTAANMAAHLDANPETYLVGLSYTDYAHYCQCADCTALDEPGVPRDQSMSRRTLIFYNAVAEELTRLRPDARILAGAYHVYNRPPQDPDLRAHPALSLVLCHYTEYCSAHAISDTNCPPNVEFDRLLRDWQRLIPEVYLYEYYHSDGAHSMPWQIVHAIRQDIPYLHDLGCGGMYTQHGAVWTTFLNYYVAAKLLWDVETDVDALLQEFYTTFFGPAAAPMEDYYTTLMDEIHASEMHLCTCSVGGLDPRRIFTTELLASLRASLEEAKRLGAADPLISARLAKVAASQEYAERYTACLTERDAMMRLTPGPERHAAAVAALQTLEAFHQEIATNRRKWDGVCNPGARHLERLLARARETAAPQHGRTGEIIRELPTQWRFALDRDEVGLEQEWFAADFDDDAWATISILDYWENQGYVDYDGVAWYRVSLEISEAEARGPLLLAFDGVDAGATVYLNSAQIGEHEGWDQPFALDVPPEALRVGETNVIAVRVTDVSGNGGFYGPVRLVKGEE